MNLNLSSDDLKPEFREKIPTDGLNFRHFQDKVREVIKAVGRATYCDKSHPGRYKAIFPPQ